MGWTKFTLIQRDLIRIYLSDVGYNSTATEFKTSIDKPEQISKQNEYNCITGISVNIHKNAHEPHPTSIETKMNSLLFKVLQVEIMDYLHIIQNWPTFFINKPITIWITANMTSKTMPCSNVSISNWVGQIYKIGNKCTLYSFFNESINYKLTLSWTTSDPIAVTFAGFILIASHIMIRCS